MPEDHYEWTQTPLPNFFKTNMELFPQADRAGGRGGGQRGKKRPAAEEEGGDFKVGHTLSFPSYYYIASRNKWYFRIPRSKYSRRAYNQGGGGVFLLVFDAEKFHILFFCRIGPHTAISPSTIMTKKHFIAPSFPFLTWHSHSAWRDE